jgi:hypothetical protein
MPLKTTSAPEAMEICCSKVVMGTVVAPPDKLEDALVPGPGPVPGGPDEELLGVEVVEVALVAEKGGGGGKGEAEGGKGLLRVRES